MAKISIITSMKTGSEHFDELFSNIEEQSIFDECQWIIFDAGSDDEEVKMTARGLHGDFYPKIKFIELDKDPGLYEVWNLGVRHSEGEYITNMNMDDRRAPWSLEELSFYLDQDHSIDVVYGECLETNKPHESFFKNSATSKFPCLPADLSNMMKVNSPHAAPMWRKSLHDEFGKFNNKYKICGDYDMWLRAISKGANFKSINSETCLYYRNPEGLSTSKENLKLAQEEINNIKRLNNPTTQLLQ